MTMHPRSSLAGRTSRPLCWLCAGLGLALASCGGDGTAIAPFWLTTGVAVADLDGDGRMDVVVAQSYVSGAPPHVGRVEVYLQTAPDRFATPVRYDVGSDPWGIALADVDGDGHRDIVTADSGSGGMSLLRQDPGAPGSFQAARHLTVGGTPYAVAVSDIDLDGHADLAVALQNSGGGGLVLLQDPGTPMAFLPPIGLANGTGALSVAVGDLNHDGLPDVALSNDSGVQVFFQGGAGGGFGSATPLTAGTRPQSVAVADLDDDGFNDLAVANAGSSVDGSGASVSVLRQNPATPGSFAAAVTVPVAAGARQLAVGQLVGDSRPDLAVVSLVYQAQNQPSRISVLRNQGSGSLVLTQEMPGPLGANFLAIGDVNADGLTDIVVNDGPALLLQQSTAPGTFGPYTALP